MIGDAALRSHALADLLTEESEVQRWLDVERALADTLAELGHVPPDAAAAVGAACRADRLDLEALRRAAASSATPVIPLVRQLVELVSPDGHGAVHRGATSQDILDSAAMCLSRRATSLLVEELSSIGDLCATLAREHRATLMVGRTLLQHAVPLTFGLKAARWLSAVHQDIGRLERLRFPVQLAGAAGTSAPFGDDGIEVASGVARRLGLDEPVVPWHAERGALWEIARTTAAAAGTCAHIAGEIIRLAQTDIAEVLVDGAGGSSTMPQKRNPVDAVMAVTVGHLAGSAAAAITGAWPHEHERAAGAWQVEWVLLPQLLDAAVAAAERTRSTLGALEVDRERAADNLSRSGDVLLAERLALELADALGRTDAHAVVAALVRRATEHHRTLRAVAEEDERVLSSLGAERLRSLLDPTGYLGTTDGWIDRALDEWEAGRR